MHLTFSGNRTLIILGLHLVCLVFPHFLAAVQLIVELKSKRPYLQPKCQASSMPLHCTAITPVRNATNTNTDIQIQIHKYIFTNTNPPKCQASSVPLHTAITLVSNAKNTKTDIQIQRKIFTNTNPQKCYASSMALDCTAITLITINTNQTSKGLLETSVYQTLKVHCTLAEGTLKVYLLKRKTI